MTNFLKPVRFLVNIHVTHIVWVTSAVRSTTNKSGRSSVNGKPRWQVKKTLKTVARARPNNLKTSARPSSLCENSFIDGHTFLETTKHKHNFAVVYDERPSPFSYKLFKIAHSLDRTVFKDLPLPVSLKIVVQTEVQNGQKSMYFFKTISILY